MNENALAYILKKKFINNLKEFVKRPARLILGIIIIALLSVSIIGGSAGANGQDRQLRDFSELSAIITGLLIIVFSTSFNKGFKQGGSIFSMADVNFLFASPLSKRSVLFYGLIQNIGTSLLIGFFILFQYTTLHVNYGIGIGGLLLIFLAYSLTVFLGQTSAMFLYILTSDSDRKKRTANEVFIAYILLLCVYVGLMVLQNKSEILPALVGCGNSLVLRSFPFAGWVSACIDGIFTGSYIEAAIWLAVAVIAFWGILTAMSRSKREYYEDVLSSTETTYNALCAVKEGANPMAARRKIKVGKSGLGKGLGASAIFYKHKVESRRAGGFIISPSAMIFALATIGFAFFMKKAGIFAVFAFATYMQIFSVATGRLNLELMKPYIYLIPEPPLRKLLYALGELFPAALLEGVVMFVPVAFILNLSMLEGLLCVIARVAFALLFTVGGIAVERIWGGSLSKLAGVLLYFVIDLLMAVPGIALFAAVSFTSLSMVSAAATLMICVTVGNALSALLVLFLCRNMLQYAET